MVLRSAAIIEHLVPSLPAAEFIFVDVIAVWSSCGVTYEIVSVISMSGFRMKSGGRVGGTFHWRGKVLAAASHISPGWFLPLLYLLFSLSGWGHLRIYCLPCRVFVRDLEVLFSLCPFGSSDGLFPLRCCLGGGFFCSFGRAGCFRYLAG